MDVRISTRGFKDPDKESTEYRKFKKKPNSGYFVERLQLGELVKLTDTS